MKYFFFFYLLFSLPILSFSQNNKISPKKDTIPSIVIKINEINLLDEEQNGNGKNIIKFGLVNLLFGDIPLFYERVLSNKLSLELGLGVNYGKGIISSYLGLDETDYVIQKNKLGLFTEANIKFFTSSKKDIPEGFYLSLGAQYKKSNFLTVNDFNQVINIPVSTTSNISLIRLSAGYAFIFDNFYTESLLGIGLRSQKSSIYTIDSNGIIVLQNTKSNNQPIFLINYKFGYVF